MAFKTVAFAVLVALIGATDAAVARDAVAAYTFERFVQEHGKQYGSESEAAERRKLFERRKSDALVHNARGTSSYYRTINYLSDWTDAELTGRNGGRVMEMSGALKELAKQPFVKNHKVSGMAVPSSLDWRDHRPNVLTAVKDQGSCGDCWAHAATENLETHFAIQTGELYTLSQQQMTSCTENPMHCGGTGGCMGATAELGYSYLVKNGAVAEEWTYPFTSWAGVTGQCQRVKSASKVRVTGYTQVAINDQQAVMDALATTGPLAVNVDASKWSSYGGGIYDGCGSTVSIDHVVQLVGYGTDNTLDKEYWIIRNSWTPAWGEHGYIRIERNPSAKCGWNIKPQNGVACKNETKKEWVCGQCGVLYRTVYPNTAVAGSL